MVAIATPNAFTNLLTNRAEGLSPVAAYAREHIYVIKRVDPDGNFVSVYGVLKGPPDVDMAEALRSYIYGYDIPRPLPIRGFVRWLEERYHLIPVRDCTVASVATDGDNNCLWAE
jgi:hypothetical protein